MRNSLKFNNLLFIVIQFSYFVSVSQNTINMETFNASGVNAVGSTGSISYSVGQVFFSYIGETVYNVAQGVQQTNLTEGKEHINNPEDINSPEANILVYPNPTTDYVNLTMKGVDLEKGQNTYQLFSYQGKLIQQQSIKGDYTQISLEKLSSSTYLLQVFVNNKILKTFKILKT